MYGDIFYAVKYLGVAVLVLAAVWVFRDFKFAAERVWFMPLTAGFMSACVGLVYAIDAGFTYSATVLFLMETLLTAAGAYFYRLALPAAGAAAPSLEGEGLKRLISLLVFAATALIALSGVTLMAEMSLGRIIALFLLMAAAYRGGIGFGAVVGAALGIAMDAAADMSCFCRAYAFAGMAAGVLRGNQRLVFSVGFIVSAASSAMLTEAPLSFYYELFAASVAFTVIPGRYLPELGTGREAGTLGAARAREYISRRVAKISGAFDALQERVKTTCEGGRNDNDISSVFDNAAEAVCRDCSASDRCWQREYISTVNALNGISQEMERRGRAEMNDFPEYFRNSCIDLRSFVEAINDELKALLYRRRYRARLRDSRSAAWEQYLNIANILGEISAEISSRAGAEPKLEKRLNAYLKGMDFESEAAVFRDKSGRLHAEIEGPDIGTLERDEKYLDKLSAAIGIRLCRKTDERPETMELMEAEPLAATVGVAGSRKKGQTVSGDKGTYFKTEEGELCVILSDGMGSGIPAAKESTDTVKILSDFLKAGVDATAALKILGSVMLLRDGETPCCSTVDLMCTDLFTGKTRLYKRGAAPSYLRQGGKIRRLTGESIVEGIESSEVLRVKLKAGDCILIVSDGATSVGDDEWIEELLQKRTDTLAPDLAMEVLETAMRRCSCCDDITAIAVCMEERK